jgi:DNA-binding MarR family transcriptional regulator
MPDSADRAFAANILGTLAQTIVDRQAIGMDAVAGFGGNAPAALVSLHYYPDRPIAFLAHRLRISHPGTVQLVDRLAAAGLVERLHAVDGRTRHLRLTDEGEVIAAAVQAQRMRVLERALSSVDDEACQSLVATLAGMLEALTDDLLTSEYMCRLCDERACPDDRCPVERAEPSPTDRRGIGYGV